MRRWVGQMGEERIDCVPPIAWAVRLFQRFTFCRRGYLLS